VLKHTPLLNTGNHTFAAVKCAEKYEVLKKALVPVFSEMNELIQDEEITVNERTVKLEIIFGGDPLNNLKKKW